MIYLDHAATTPLDNDILEKMLPYMRENFGNASSQHAYGRNAANAAVAARDEIAAVMGVPSADLYFTGGGTEAANTAVKGVCLANAEKGKHLIISAIEHPAVTESAKDLTELGFEVTYLPCDEEGRISPRALENALRKDTVLVGVMSANNETGVVQPVKEIYRICRERGVFYYCDCVQTAGVLPFSEFPADGIGISAHKFYGPKGFGALYMRSGIKFKRLLSGGHQERAMRGGTTFTAGAVGCAAALKKAAENAERNNKKISALRDRFLNGIFNEIEGVHLNGGIDHRLPSNANVSFDGCDGENLLFLLDLAGVAVSTGSACSSGAVTPSHVLTAMGLSESRAKSAVRFTFGKYNTEEDADRAVAAVKSAVSKIRNR